MNEVADALQEHLSKRDTFDQLTEDQRQAILALLDAGAISRCAYSPPPPIPKLIIAPSPHSSSR